MDTLFELMGSLSQFMLPTVTTAGLAMTSNTKQQHFRLSFQFIHKNDSFFLLSEFVNFYEPAVRLTGTTSDVR